MGDDTQHSGRSPADAGEGVLNSGVEVDAITLFQPNGVFAVLKRDATIENQEKALAIVTGPVTGGARQMDDHRLHRRVLPGVC